MKIIITIREIWDHIIDSKCKPRPLKYVIDGVIDKIIATAGNKNIDEIVKDLGTSGKELVYDNLTAGKKVLFHTYLMLFINGLKSEKFIIFRDLLWNMD